MKSVTTIFILVVLLSLPAPGARAGSGAGGIVLSFNTSARAEGMGGAGVAVPWGGDTDHWANPALLAFRPGIHYLDFRSELAKGLADDIVMTNREMTIGAFGATLLVGRGPVDGKFLDMGFQEATDESGTVTGQFQSYMKSEHLGFGVDLARVGESVLGKPEGAFTRRVSLAIGYVWKDFEDQLAPDGVIQDAQGGGGGSGKASDRGIMLRVTPLRRGMDAESGSGGTVGTTLDLAFGMSTINRSGEFIRHVDADQSDPFPTSHLWGFAARFALPLTPAKRAEWDGKGWGILGATLDPLLSLTASFQDNDPGYVWDPDLQEYRYERDGSGTMSETGYGVELGLCNVLYYRLGRNRAEYADIDDWTQGWGANVQVGRYGGFRYDWAEVPQSEGLPKVVRRTWSVWVDPVAAFFN